MKKSYLFILAGYMVVILPLSLIAADATETKPLLIRSTSNFPKDVQRQIAQLELQAAAANQASIDAEDIAEKKEAELKALEAKSSEEDKALQSLNTELASTQKELEDAQSKQAIAYKEAAAQKNLASSKQIEAAAHKKEIARLKKQGASQIADGTTKKQALADADKESAQAAKLELDAKDDTNEANSLQNTGATQLKNTTTLLGELNKDVKPTPTHNLTADTTGNADKQNLTTLASSPDEKDTINRINGFLNTAQGYAKKLDIVLVKDNEDGAKQTWIQLIGYLSSAHKAISLLNDNTKQTILQASQLADIRKSVAALLGSLERQINLLSGESQHALFAIYETWAHQWAENPLGDPALKQSTESFIKKFVTPHDNNYDGEVAPPPAY